MPRAPWATTRGGAPALRPPYLAMAFSTATASPLLAPASSGRTCPVSNPTPVASAARVAAAAAAVLEEG
nr:unnamed protein product [Digitaria exilis]